MLGKVAQKFLNHTCIRIADPARSLAFYEKNFGMKLVTQLDVKEVGFTLYYLGFTGPKSLYKDTPWYKRGGLLELTHNHGATPENFEANNGNKEPHRGFGHICFSVSDLEKTCEKLEGNGVGFQKRLTDGRQKNIAFALDPDGYWIELIRNGNEGAESPETCTTRFNHSMIRVKDKDAALDFYTNKLGMTLVDTSDFPEAKFTLFFLSFDPTSVKERSRGGTEGLIELTYNYGSEQDVNLHYHNGNTDPQGFGHFGVTVPDAKAFLSELESKGVRVTKQLTEGKMKFMGFVSDPDGYLIEVLPQRDFPKDLFSPSL
uniref:Lactoylglutathione lyase n=1 Tax=Starmerella magnoliae TaxID=5490 RepID=D6QLX5_9ASCO|nr:glyoxalase I [Starmerella magnoliae]